jgi:hypothetical protein
VITGKKESGSAHIVIIIVLLFAILGLLGFNFWQNFMYKKDTKPVASSDGTAITTPAKQVDDSSKDYIFLKDWGVKFKIPESKSEIIDYAVQNEFGTHYEFTTRRVEALGENCVKPNGQGPAGTLGAISRSATKIEEPMGSEAVNNNEALNGYYYYVSASQAPCASASHDIQSEDRSTVVRMLLSPVVIR